MFGIGAQEMLIIVLLALIVFGPDKLPRMARDLGRFVQKARASTEEFKSGFAFEEPQKVPREELEGRPRSGRHRKSEEGRAPEGVQESHGPKEGREEDRILDEDRGRKEDRRPERETAGAQENDGVTFGREEVAPRRTMRGGVHDVASQ